jgi:uncharacterized protein YqeY
VRILALKDHLYTDLKDAMRARDEDRKRALRMLLSAIKNAEIDRRGELDDQEIQAVVAKEIKLRREAIVEFKKGERQDLVDEEEAELKVLLAYMPEQLTEDEIAALARQVIAEVGATGPRDMGKVMKHLMPSMKGKADGQVVSGIVKKLLQEKA